MHDLFVWHSTDVTRILPSSWRTELLSIARSAARTKDLTPTSVTSRESSEVARVRVTTVGGIELARSAPWLEELYRTTFRELAESIYQVPVACAEDRRIGINLNLQSGISQRYEAHVDSNPIEGLLYVTSQPPGAGGELVVSTDEEAVGIGQIDASCTTIFPHSGNLVFFDARKCPHYVRPLMRPDDERIVVAMNFYTDECQEKDRPADLNQHLFGRDTVVNQETIN